MSQSKIIKKMTPFAIAAVLVLTFFMVFAAPASAADPVCEIIRAGDTFAQYEDLGDALAAVQDGDTIKLLKKIDYERGISIEDIRVTFDVNGFILNVICSDETTERDALDVNRGEVLLIDTSSLGGGEFNVITRIENRAGVYARSGGKATVTNAAGDYGVYANASATVNVFGNVSGAICGVYANGSSAVTIDGVIETENQYVIVDDTAMSQTDHRTTSTRPGYLEYAGGTGFVWVKDSAASNGGGSGTDDVNQTKIGVSLLWLGGLVLVLVLAAAIIFYLKKARK